MASDYVKLVLIYLAIILSLMSIMYTININNKINELRTEVGNVVNNTMDPEIIQCFRKGGIWKEFNDSCAGICMLDKDVTEFCAQVLTDGCDCGDGKCWNGSACTVLIE